MAMTLSGLAKLAEELGELQQLVGKKIAYFNTDVHPDGGPPLSQRLAEEMADVKAAIAFVSFNLDLDSDLIDRREGEKLKRFIEWDKLE